MRDDPPSVGDDAPTGPDLARAEEMLAEHLGPIARILVKRTAQGVATRDEFIAALAGEIDDTTARDGFVEAMKKR